MKIFEIGRLLQTMYGDYNSAPFYTYYPTTSPVPTSSPSPVYYQYTPPPAPVATYNNSNGDDKNYYFKLIVIVAVVLIIAFVANIVFTKYSPYVHNWAMQRCMKEAMRQQLTFTFLSFYFPTILKVETIQ
jgi:hypothetical protein